MRGSSELNGLEDFLSTEALRISSRETNNGKWNGEKFVLLSPIWEREREGGARYFSSLAKTTPWLTTKRKEQPPLAEQNHPLPQSSTLGIFVCGWFTVEGGLSIPKQKPHQSDLKKIAVYLIFLCPK